MQANGQLGVDPKTNKQISGHQGGECSNGNYGSYGNYGKQCYGSTERKRMTLHADSAYLLSLLTSRHYAIAIEVKNAMH